MRALNIEVPLLYFKNQNHCDNTVGFVLGIYGTKLKSELCVLPEAVVK